MKFPASRPHVRIFPPLPAAARGKFERAAGAMLDVKLGRRATLFRRSEAGAPRSAAGGPRLFSQVAGVPSRSLHSDSPNPLSTEVQFVVTLICNDSKMVRPSNHCNLRRCTFSFDSAGSAPRPSARLSRVLPCRLRPDPGPARPSRGTADMWKMKSSAIAPPSPQGQAAEPHYFLPLPPGAGWGRERTPAAVLTVHPPSATPTPSLASSSRGRRQHAGNMPARPRHSPAPVHGNPSAGLRAGWGY